MMRLDGALAAVFKSQLQAKRDINKKKGDVLCPSRLLFGGPCHLKCFNSSRVYPLTHCLIKESS